MSRLLDTVSKTYHSIDAGKGAPACEDKRGTRTLRDRTKDKVLLTLLSVSHSRYRESIVASSQRGSSLTYSD